MTSEVFGSRTFSENGYKFEEEFRTYQDGGPFKMTRKFGKGGVLESLTTEKIEEDEIPKKFRKDYISVINR